MYTLHSWLRYVVFVVGLSTFGYSLRGWLGRRPYCKRMWDLASAFAVLLFAEVLSGFLLVFTNRYFSGPLGLHMAFSMAAAAVAQLTYSTNRRRPRDERRYETHVWGSALALALVVAGILIIRSSPFS